MMILQCPCCGYLAEHITVNHMRSHSCDTREQFLERYGAPRRVSVPVNAKLRRWIRDSSIKTTYNTFVR